MLNVVETFSGIGSQTEALKNAGIEHRVSAIVEWEIGAMYAYDIIHHGKQDLSKYRKHTKETLIERLAQYNLSTDGKSLASFQSIATMSMHQLKSILHAIENNNNLVDITQVHAKDLESNIDVLTYSFPCQDLSVSSHWWKNTSGITKGSGNRSSLLWEIERILKEFSESKKTMPKFLLMENVPAILGKLHIDNFNLWRKELESLGYYNQTYTLNAKNFGIPQGRERTYMLSIYIGENLEKYTLLEQYFFENNLEHIQLAPDNINSLKNYLKLDYRIEKYRKEAIASTPNFTPSREKIFLNNPWLATDNKINHGKIARTITTKQDRNPNSGIITYSEGKELVDGCKYRNLTPREAFLLMGFKEESFDLLMSENINYNVAKDRPFLPDSKVLKLCGNSIVVNVLEQIFLQFVFIKDNLFKRIDEPSENKMSKDVGEAIGY